MISTGSAEGPIARTTVPTVSPNILFGPDSLHPFSHVFEVKNTPVVLAGFGLCVSDRVFVERITGPGSGNASCKLRIQGTTVALDTENTVIKLDLPGRYRLQYQGTTPLGAFTVDKTSGE